MNNEHPIESLMKSTLENIKEMIDVNTIVGEAVETKNGTYIIPISKVSFGFASGGSDFSPINSNTEGKFPFGGGSGAGITIKPIAFLIATDDTVKLIPVEGNNPYSALADYIPLAMDKLKDLFNKEKKDIKKDMDSCDCYININNNSENI